MRTMFASEPLLVDLDRLLRTTPRSRDHVLVLLDELVRLKRRLEAVRDAIARDSAALRQRSGAIAAYSRTMKAGYSR